MELLRSRWFSILRFGVLSYCTPCLMGWGIALPVGWVSTSTLFGQVISGAAGGNSSEPFPNDWYVRDGEGLEGLRSLEGKPAPEISIAEWKGDPSPLSKLKGKIVVLDFWATWCGPCMAAIPKNVEFIGKYREKGVELIGVHDAKAGWDEVDRVISEKGIQYPVGLDQSSGETTKAYSLKFWPTYFVIDREGVIRGAGIKPNKIEEAVNILLAGSNPPSPSAPPKLASFPEKWFLGGGKRSKRMLDSIGKRVSKLHVSEWIGTEIERDDWDRRVRVVQYVRPEISVSVDQLTKLQGVAERFAKQGVTFLAVCDARSDKVKMESIADEKRIEIPIAFDQANPKGSSTIGMTGESMGIPFAPTTIVIDRAGVLRASGVKPDFLDSILNQLLAESVPMDETPDEVLDVVEVRPEKTKMGEKESRPKPDAVFILAPEEGLPPAPESVRP